MILPVNFILPTNWSIRVTTEKTRKFHVVADGRNWDFYASAVRPESSNYTAQSGLVKINTRNASLTGSGTTNTDIWTVLTGASKGTVIKKVIIKSIKTGTVTEGMIRLFINDARGDGTAYTKLLKEIPVQAITQSATAESFSAEVDFGADGFFLKNTYQLRITTENSEEFVVFAEGLDLAYPA